LECGGLAPPHSKSGADFMGFLDFPIFLDLAGQGTPMAGRPSSKYFGKYPKKFLRAWQLPISGRRSRYFKLVFGILLVLRQQKG
jgi:hypothetical protein